MNFVKVNGRILNLDNVCGINIEGNVLFVSGDGIALDLENDETQAFLTWLESTCVWNGEKQPAAPVEDETILIGDFVEFVCDVTVGMLYNHSADNTPSIAKGDTFQIIAVDPADYIMQYAIRGHEVTGFSGYDQVWIRREWIKKVQS